MPRILIIEDDPTTRLGVELVLCALGFDVDTSSDGLDGLIRMREVPPDLVICDMVMPVLDGYGVIDAAQQEPKLARIPFIFLTSLSDRETWRKAMSAGADDVLIKPVLPSELVDAIRARFRRLALLGPDCGAVEASLLRVRELISGSGKAILDVLGSEPITDGNAPMPEQGEVLALPQQTRLEYWVARLRLLFDENNPDALLYRTDEVTGKKQLIHAAYLLSKLYLKLDNRRQGEAEFAIADSVLKVNAERMRSVINNTGDPALLSTWLKSRVRILRLERKLNDLRREWSV